MRKGFFEYSVPPPSVFNRYHESEEQNGIRDHMESAKTAISALVLLIITLLVNGCGDNTASTPAAVAGLRNLSHVIIVIQENHSFDNYFGVLPYAGSTSYFSSPNPYHPPPGPGPCAARDSSCVDGLTCSGTTPQICANFNFQGSNQDFSTHTSDYCPSGGPNHDWTPMHQKANYCDPNSLDSLNNGFAQVDDSILPMEYYNETDLPYYYAVAETFAISDRHFASLIGPTLSDRMYTMAATSFGHLNTDAVNDQPPGPPGYQPITGSIFDLLDAAHQRWAEYYECGANAVPPRPYAQLFRYADIPNFVHLSNTDPADQFREFAAATRGANCTLPAVSYVSLYNHEHPPFSIQAGQHDVSVLINDLRSGPCWRDSIMFITYDEGGGFYDHVVPPAAVSPDGIAPGECSDFSNPPASLKPGGGANCSSSFNSQQDLKGMLLPGEKPADFTQLGFRIPLLAVSPFAKPHYVSHVVSDHTSILKLIEERFLGGISLTSRDARASDLTDMFDFVNAPSAGLRVSPAVAPTPGISGDCPAPLPTPEPSCTIPVPIPSPAPSATPGPTSTPVVCTIPGST
jgi:phospholipase C